MEERYKLIVQFRKHLASLISPPPRFWEYLERYSLEERIVGIYHIGGFLGGRNYMHKSTQLWDEYVNPEKL